MPRRDPNVPKRPRKAESAGTFIHFRASTQLTDALDAAADEQNVSRSELMRTILETTLQTGTLSEIGARQGLFHFHAALKRAISYAAPEVLKVFERHLEKEVADLELTGAGPAQEEAVDATRKKIERRVQQEKGNRARVVRPSPMLEDDEDDVAGLLPEGFGPG